MSAPVRSRSEKARDWLRQRIVSGEWELNTRIPSETALAEELGVARGTVREAVRALTELGMLEAAAGRGTFVRSRTPADRVVTDVIRDHGPAECLQTRAALEADAARRLAESDDSAAIERLASLARPQEGRVRLPGEFHATLVESGSGQLSVSIHAALLSSVRDFLLEGRLEHAIDDEQRCCDHEGIVARIIAKDPAGAAIAAANHAMRDFRVVF